MWLLVPDGGGEGAAANLSVWQTAADLLGPSPHRKPLDGLQRVIPNSEEVCKWEACGGCQGSEVRMGRCGWR